MDKVNKINGYTNLYALMGNPAKHSFSPFIHNNFFNKYKINSVYLSFEILPDDFKTAFLGAYKLGFSGVNLTMPFKEEVLNFIEEIDEDAKTIKAVNTIKFDKEKKIIKGFNTDINGFIKCLDNNRYQWDSGACLVIGAGGAAKSSIYALIKKKVKKIYIYNRTLNRADKIKILFKEIENNKIIVLERLNTAPLNDINLIINCTPAGMKQYDFLDNSLPIPSNWDLNGKFVFEMVYNPAYTPLVKKSINDGAKVIFGTEMLLNQAAFSFEIWNGFMPDLKYLNNYFKNSFK